MKQDDELWMKKMREILQDYNEPAPPEVWKGINKKLYSPVHRKILTNKWWGAAAAVLLLAVTGLSFYFLRTPAADDIRLTNVPVVETVVPKTVVPVIAEGEQGVKGEKGDRGNKGDRDNRDNKGDRDNRDNKGDRDNRDNKGDIGNKGDINNKADIVDTKEGEVRHIAKSTENVNERKKSDKKTVIEDLSSSVAKNKTSKKWSVGLSVNSGTASLATNNVNNPIQINSTTQLSTDDLASVPSNSTGYVDVSDKNIIYREGIAQIAEFEEQKNHLPITVGLSLRKEIGDGFSIETGLSYTFLKSDINKNGRAGEMKGEQKLHYIGIPLRANWDFVKSKRFNVYLSAGGMVEKRVYGKKLDEKITDKPFQFSLNGGIGAQYNLSKRVGLYVEPGVSYFFDDGSIIETIRKENPFNFNLQAGVRFTY